MKVRLITKTQGAEGTEYEGRSLDEIIVGIARLSSGREVNNLFENPVKLIRHCVTHGHWSIFGMANLTFEVQTSRAIGRELLRHWSLAPQEFSQRYANVTEFEEVELRMQATSNRQSSLEVSTDPQLNAMASEAIRFSQEAYEGLLRGGVARESARLVLPETAQTTLIFNGKIRDWTTTLHQRLHKTTQKECRLVAEAIAEVFQEELPLVSEALFNFEHAYDIPILDQVVLEKYGLREDVIEKVKSSRI